MFNPFGTNSWDSPPAPASRDANENFDLFAVNPDGAPRTRPPGHNRPKNASDWLAQIVCVLAVVGAIGIWGGSSNVVPMVITIVVVIPYVALIEWLAHMEDRATAN